MWQYNSSIHKIFNWEKIDSPHIWQSLPDLTQYQHILYATVFVFLD